MSSLPTSSKSTNRATRVKSSSLTPSHVLFRPYRLQIRMFPYGRVTLWRRALYEQKQVAAKRLASFLKGGRVDPHADADRTDFTDRHDSFRVDR